MHFKLIMLLSAVALNVNAEPVSKFINAKNSGEYFEMQGATVISSELIPIEQLKKYQLKGSFKNPTGTPVTLLFGVVSFDANKKEINVISVSAIKGTDTVLAENCSPEDKIIKVNDASAWKNNGASTVVFETDRELKDLPNYNCAISSIEAITRKGEIWEIRLKEACGRDYQAGVSVRQHYNGNTFVYTVISKLEPNSGWTNFEGTIKPSSKEIMSPSNIEYLRRGSAFVKIVIIGAPSNKLWFKNIDFTSLNN